MGKEACSTMGLLGAKDGRRRWRISRETLRRCVFVWLMASTGPYRSQNSEFSQRARVRCLFMNPVFSGERVCQIGHTDENRMYRLHILVRTEQQHSAQEF